MCSTLTLHRGFIVGFWLSVVGPPTPGPTHTLLKVYGLGNAYGKCLWCLHFALYSSFNALSLVISFSIFCVLMAPNSTFFSCLGLSPECHFLFPAAGYLISVCIAT